MNTEKRNDRPESYPKPTETDSQWQNQPEFIDDNPNDLSEKKESKVSVNGPGQESQADLPNREEA